ncbi:MAG: DUF4037 domain-containing protein [Desulfitobacteriaceae bacterium]
MQGLELSEKYFNHYGMPMIIEKFAVYADRIAAGLVGDGSECFGFDDDISRDHDWGPSFCLWLTPKDYQIIGNALQAEISKLPQEFARFGPRQVSAFGGDRIGVFEIGSFYQNFIGLDRLPASLNEWLSIPEDVLAVSTNGKVFYDPLGVFTGFRNGLKKFYPEDVRLKKIASRCMTIAQFGQYNFSRCIKRKEYVAADYAEAKFCSDVISVVFLLNSEYKPFFKWMHRALRYLPLLGEFVYSAVNEIVTSIDYAQKYSLIEKICTAIREEFQRQGLSDSTSDFLQDHGPVIQQRIKDPSLRAQNVLLG